MSELRPCLHLALGLLTLMLFSLPACSPGKELRAPVYSDSDAMLRQEVVAFARQYLGTNYKYAGRDPRTGFDCSGFTGFVMGYFDIPVNGPSGSQEKLGHPIDVKDARAGDLIFFRRSKGGAVFHVSLVVSNGSDGLTVIHSTSGRGVVIDNIPSSSYWRAKYATARDVISK